MLYYALLNLKTTPPTTKLIKFIILHLLKYILVLSIFIWVYLLT